LSANCIPSLSTTVTIALAGLPTVRPLGGEDKLMVREKSSASSQILSSIIGTLKDIMVSPAINVTLYGPES